MGNPGESLQSGTGTNLKLGGTRPARTPEYFCRAPPLFGSIGRFGERFRDGQYSLVSFLFAVLLLTVRSPVHSYL